MDNKEIIMLIQNELTQTTIPREHLDMLKKENNALRKNNESMQVKVNEITNKNLDLQSKLSARSILDYSINNIEATTVITNLQKQNDEFAETIVKLKEENEQQKKLIESRVEEFQEVIKASIQATFGVLEKEVKDRLNALEQFLKSKHNNQYSNLEAFNNFNGSLKEFAERSIYQGYNIPFRCRIHKENFIMPEIEKQKELNKLKDLLTKLKELDLNKL